ncbi:MAG TPA: peptidase MA family metallohydrolase [Dehalococcoidia bacterium]
MLRITMLLVAVATLSALLPQPRPAAAAIEVRANTVANRFPDGLQFTLFTASDANITDVRLRFRILPFGVNATIRPNCTTGSTVNCTANVGSSRESYMVPGAGIVYYWEITDASGARLVTEEQTTTYEDRRFEWQTIEDGNISVHYYFGDLASQQSVLKTARETLDRFSQLEGTTIDFPVKIWVYRTAAEMAPAVASRRGQGPDTSIQTLGEVGAADTALVSRDQTFLDIVRHELAHIVTGRATRNHITEIPIWINEGLSTYAQKALLPSEEQALALAIQRNRVLPITSLNASARGSANDVSIFYAQSGSIIAYLVNTHGDEKFAAFIAALANDTTDKAMQAVYGFDQTGLENLWRKAVGLPEIGAPGAAGTPAAGPTQVPTLTPFGAGNQSRQTPQAGGQSAANNGDDGDETTSFLIISAAVLSIALLAVAGLYLQRRRAG